MYTFSWSMSVSLSTLIIMSNIISAKSELPSSSGAGGSLTSGTQLGEATSVGERLGLGVLDVDGGRRHLEVLGGDGGGLVLLHVRHIFGVLVGGRCRIH